MPIGRPSQWRKIGTIWGGRMTDVQALDSGSAHKSSPSVLQHVRHVGAHVIPTAWLESVFNDLSTS